MSDLRLRLADAAPTGPPGAEIAARRAGVVRRLKIAGATAFGLAIGVAAGAILAFALGLFVVDC